LGVGNTHPSPQLEVEDTLPLTECSKRNAVKVNGSPVAGATPGDYLAIKRRWSASDAVELSFDMQPKAVHANLGGDRRSRVDRLTVGPILYGMEPFDQAVAPRDTKDFPRYTAQLIEATATAYQPDLLEGVVVLEHPGAWLPTEPGSLYRATLLNGEAAHPTTLRLIPYYAWSNRQLSATQVWIPSRLG
jgi:uncharacterized protein